MLNNILVTGANGFVGYHLIENINSKYSIVGQVRRFIEPTLSEIPLFELDVSSESNWRKNLQGVNTIIHLAAVAHNKANNLDYINEVNVKGTVNLACQAVECGVKRFIFISSIGVLGNSTFIPFNEESPFSAHSSYTESKLLAEQELLKISEETGLEVIIIRPALVYGADAPGNFGKLVNLVRKTTFLPFGLCKNKRSFISIDNLVNFISLCIEHPNAKNEVFCISDIDVSIREFTDGIAHGMNKKLVQLPVPIWLFKLLGITFGKYEMVEQLVGDLQIDSRKARTLLNWKPPFTMAETFYKLNNKK